VLAAEWWCSWHENVTVPTSPLLARTRQNVSPFQARLANIIEHTTFAVIQNVNRSLFDQHKVAFGALVALAILRAADRIDPHAWHTMLHGPPASHPHCALAPPEGIPLEPAQWQLACYLEDAHPSFAGFREHMTAHASDWLYWMREPLPWLQPPPTGWGEQSVIQVQLLVKVFRPELVLGAIDHLTASTLGQRFVQRSPLELSKVWGLFS
jgi:hypothetical protein